MQDREQDSQREIGELAERHRATKDRAIKLVDEMEAGNVRLRELIDSYRRADEALSELRRS